MRSLLWPPCLKGAVAVGDWGILYVLEKGSVDNGDNILPPLRGPLTFLKKRKQKTFESRAELVVTVILCPRFWLPCAKGGVFSFAVSTFASLREGGGPRSGGGSLRKL